MKDKIYRHFHENDYLEDEEIKELISQYPQAVYKGVAYRVLILKRKEMINQTFSLEKDKSFSKSLNGIQHFLNMNDMFSYYKLFQVEIIGLDSSILCDIFNITNPHNREDEIIAYKIQDVTVLSQGQIKDFSNNL